ncbi:MAG TPA: dTDP-4-dehydrorhamnose 3,5-epimerase [Thermoanaerobaculia bacterium]|nr:dTDP-4-dehydrorhamnose 3,5-epimerase [Thermoanaerobaculia bacterium]
MRFLPTEIPDVVVVEPLVHRDPRGFFLEVYHERKFREGGIAARFVQDNHSRSVRGTLRGLHAQRARPQGKLVRAIGGIVWDVAVDIRRGSPTFRRWVGVELSAENLRQLWIPPGFAHGFCVLSETAEIEYKCTELYDAEDEIALAWDDPELGIAWPVADPIVSAKDRAARRLAEMMDELPSHL